MTCAHCFDDEDVGHDGENVVVGGKGSQPVDGKVVDPDDEDREVDRENPEHQDEETVDVVVEVVIVARTLNVCVSVSRLKSRRVIAYCFLC